MGDDSVTDTKLRDRVLSHALRVHRVYLGEMLAKAKTEATQHYWGAQVEVLDEMLGQVEQSGETNADAGSA